MRQILAGGAAAALALGALSGHFMHPNLLAAAERPAGPQILTDGTDGAADSGAAILAAYHGQPPDYVLGTDTTRPGSGWLNGEPAVTRARYDAAPHADDPDLSQDDDTTAAERDPNDPSREPAYDSPAPRRAPINPPRYAPGYGYDRPAAAYERPAYGRPAYERQMTDEDEADGPTGA